MDRRAARRSVSVGALLALTVWMGGLPAAVADEPVPDTPTAAAPAAPGVGDDSATDVTPTPEPSPSAEAPDPAPNPEPTPSTEPTPTPEPSSEPSNPGTRNGEEPTQPEPGSEPTPTDDPPVPKDEDGQKPRSTPSVPPPTPTITRGPAVDASLAADPITIGDFDCSALTTTVTLDNSQFDVLTLFTINVSRWQHTWGSETTWEQVETLEPGVTKNVTAPLSADGYSTVYVHSQYGAEAVKSGACGSFVFDPRGTIAAFDCDALSVEVTFDNSRSTTAAYFHAFRTAQGGLGGWDNTRRLWVDVGVSAGELKTVDVPLLADAVNSVSLEANGPYSVGLGDATETCGFLRHATVGPLDCAALTAVVHLNNESVPVTTGYRVQVGDGLSERFETSREVAPGATEQLVVPLVENTPNVVSVLGPGEWVLATRAAVCGTVTEQPTATIGTFDCSRLSVPVTLDNSLSTVSVGFTVSMRNSHTDHSEDTTHVVAPGGTAVVPIPLADKAVNTAQVFWGYFDEYGPLLAEARGPSCGLVEVSNVDCDSMALRVALDGPDRWGGPFRVTYLISSTRYPTDSTAYNRSVLVTADSTKVMHVPVDALKGGGLRIQEVGTTQVTYEEAVVVDCPAGSGESGAESTATSGTEVLAATGAEGLPQLVLGGLLLLMVGGVLLRFGWEEQA